LIGACAIAFAAVGYKAVDFNGKEVEEVATNFLYEDLE